MRAWHVPSTAEQWPTRRRVCQVLPFEAGSEDAGGDGGAQRVSWAFNAVRPFLLPSFLSNLWERSQTHRKNTAVS